MTQKTYLQITGLLFTVGTIVHLLRFLMGWEVNFAGWIVPSWLSLVAVALAGFMAYSAYKLMR